MGLATIEPNQRLKGVNNLTSGPAIKTTNTCTDNPQTNKLILFIYLTCFISPENSNTAFSSTSYFLTAFEESVLDCISKPIPVTYDSVTVGATYELYKFEDGNKAFEGVGVCKKNILLEHLCSGNCMNKIS